MDVNFKKFKNILLQRQKELKLLSKETVKNTSAVELDQTSVGRLSRMDALQRQAMGKETARRREIESLRIDNALRKIEDEEFGYCDRCGDAIDIRRLELDPVLSTCISCAN